MSGEHERDHPGGDPQEVRRPAGDNDTETGRDTDPLGYRTTYVFTARGAVASVEVEPGTPREPAASIEAGNGWPVGFCFTHVYEDTEADQQAAIEELRLFRCDPDPLDRWRTLTTEAQRH